MVMLQQWSLMEGEWKTYGGGQFSGGRVMNGNLVEGQWSCYRSGHFNGGRMVMLQRWKV